MMPGPERPGPGSGSCSTRPSIRNAFLLDYDADITVGDAVRGVAEIVSSKCITYASRIRGGKVCVYLDNIECVEKVIDKEYLVIKNKQIKVNRYGNEATKVFLYHVSPSMEDDVLRGILGRYGRVVSSIMELKLGLSDDLMHVKSFTRFAYVILNDGSLPEAVNINMQGISWQIYLRKADNKCYKCKKVGHFARDCKEDITTEDRQDIMNSTSPNESKGTIIEKQSVTFAEKVQGKRLEKIDRKQNRSEVIENIDEIPPSNLKKRKIDVDNDLHPINSLIGEPGTSKSGNGAREYGMNVEIEKQEGQVGEISDVAFEDSSSESTDLVMEEEEEEEEGEKEEEGEEEAEERAEEEEGEDGEEAEAEEEEGNEEEEEEGKEEKEEVVWKKRIQELKKIEALISEKEIRKKTDVFEKKKDIEFYTKLMKQIKWSSNMPFKKKDFIKILCMVDKEEAVRIVNETAKDILKLREILQTMEEMCNCSKKKNAIKEFRDKLI